MRQSRMNNPETLPKLGIQDIDKDKQNTKNTKQKTKTMSNTDTRKTTGMSPSAHEG
jgi:hypothetical protein